MAADFAGQLPELLRGVFYGGWNPSRVPVKFGPREYVLRFARDAGSPSFPARLTNSPNREPSTG